VKSSRKHRAATVRALILLAIITLVAGGAGAAASRYGLTRDQAIAIGVFLAAVIATVCFWEFRLPVAFLSVSALLLTKTLDIEHLVKFSSLQIILFLVGMMIIVGALKGMGIFTWLIQKLMRIPNLNATRFLLYSSLLSAFLSCVVGEVTSIIIMMVIVLQICRRLKVNPIPFVLISVITTNVGSAGTMLGNPVGIFIGVHAGLSFIDFIIWAFPLMLVILAATIGILFFWYRADLREFDLQLDDLRVKNIPLAAYADVPHRQGLFVLFITVLFIALHKEIEDGLGLAESTVLIVAPLIVASIMLIWKRQRALHYVERDVEWSSLLFFLLLFGMVGTLEYTGVAEVMADVFAHHHGDNMFMAIGSVSFITAIGSGFVDNVLMVATFTPVIKNLAADGMQVAPIWWALLFGACLGGNLTVVGSTANIVAASILEKEQHRHISFLSWLKIGTVMVLVTTTISWLVISLLAPWM